MKIKATQCSKESMKSVRGILLYGTNYSKMSWCFDMLTDKYLGLGKSSVVEISLRVHKKEGVSMIRDALFSMGFMGSSIVKVVDVNEGAVKDIIKILQGYNGNNYLIILGGNLGVSSKLRKMFDTSKNMLSITAYDNMEYESVEYAERILRGSGFEYEAGVERLFGNILDPISIDNEMDKLFNFIGDKQNITLCEAKKCIVGDAVYHIDDLCVNIGMGDIKKVMYLCNVIFTKDVAGVYCIRSIVRYFMRLRDVVLDKEISKNVEMSVSNMKPAIFFHYKKSFTQQVYVWEKHEVDMVLQRLLEIEVFIKSNNLRDDKTVIMHYIEKLLLGMVFRNVREKILSRA